MQLFRYSDPPSPHAFTGPLAPTGVPVWKPFLNRREMVLRYLMRPVPVVFLRLAFSDQLSISPSNVSHLFPISFYPSFSLLGSSEGKRTLADLGGRVSARRALLGLVVEGAAATPAAEAVGLVVPSMLLVPSRPRARVVVGSVYRLPKLEVPFAVWTLASPLSQIKRRSVMGANASGGTSRLATREEGIHLGARRGEATDGRGQWYRVHHGSRNAGQGGQTYSFCLEVEMLF